MKHQRLMAMKLMRKKLMILFLYWLLNPSPVARTSASVARMKQTARLFTSFPFIHNGFYKHCSNMTP